MGLGVSDIANETPSNSHTDRRLSPARISGRRFESSLRRIAQWRARFVAGVARPIFANPLYPLTLGRRAPEIPAIAPPETWPAKAAHGAMLLDGSFVAAGRRIALGDIATLTNKAEPTELDRDILAAYHGFAWLADLRATGNDAARQLARHLIDAWSADHRSWHDVVWRPDVMGRRVASWLDHGEFYGNGADDEFLRARNRSLARQARHLARAVRLGIFGRAPVAALKGSIYALCRLNPPVRPLERALEKLGAVLDRVILGDGGHVSRNPSILFDVLRDLVDIHAVLIANGRDIPQELYDALEGIARMVRFLRHGDGGLALFNHGGEEDPACVEMALTRAEARGRARSRAHKKMPAAAPHSGFHRLSAGRSLVLLDAGAPPPPGADLEAHAGTLSFEFSAGRERIVVNCGAAPGGRAWRAAGRATAAHSTLTVADRNSSDVRADGGLGKRARIIEQERLESDGNIWVTAAHDGYRRRFAIVHRRRIFLAATGENLRGEDSLTGGAGQDFALRFHLHPKIRASLAQDARSVLLRLANGDGWQFRAAMAEGEAPIALAESVYWGAGETPRHGQQIVLNATVPATGAATLKWAFARIDERR